jgi:hypothetical protein
MLLIVVPNLALQQQVRVRHECSSVRFLCFVQIMDDVAAHQGWQPLPCIKGCDARRQDPRCVVAAKLAIVELTGAGCICYCVYSFIRDSQTTCTSWPHLPQVLLNQSRNRSLLWTKPARLFKTEAGENFAESGSCTATPTSKV